VLPAFARAAQCPGCRRLFAAEPGADFCSDTCRADVHDAFRARLRTAQAARQAVTPAAAAAASAGLLQTPADSTPAAPGPAPRNPKNSVAAPASETPSDLRVAGESEGAQRPSEQTTDPGRKYDRRNDRQQARMRMLDNARAITKLTSLRKCGDAPIGGSVAVTQKADGSGGFAGLFRCGSVWACPECSPVVRGERAAQLEAAGAAWLGAGHGLGMATLTSRHGEHARLAHQVPATTGAWRRMLQSRWYRKWCAKYGVVGLTRAVEMTHSWSNSWHTHIHALIWTEEPITAETARAMEAALYERWVAECKHAKLGKPSRKHGVKVDPCRRGVEGAADLARYLVKLQDKDADKPVERALGNEMLRGDLKAGRHSSRTPFEILRAALAGSERDLELWHEYETATKGHRMLTWSGTIKDRLAELGVEIGKETDAQLAVAEDRKTRAVLAQVEPEPWQRAVSAVPGRRGQLRTAVAVASAAAMQAGTDQETAARGVVCELLTGWGLVRGADFYGPGDTRFDQLTGEMFGTIAPIAPAAPPANRPHPQWQTAEQLHATREILDIRPVDAVRPDRARRRAQGLPVVRTPLEVAAEAAIAEAVETPAGPSCTTCGGHLDPRLVAVGGRHIGC
jgi:hypothetical protein